jgi:tRNA-intron endonuclease
MALLAEVEKATKLSKSLLVALVDEEGDLTYYETSEAHLRGSVPALPSVAATAHLLEDRVAIVDEEQAKKLHAEGWFGRDAGIALQLSFPEAMYLMESGRLRVEGHDASSLLSRASEKEPDFTLRLDLYRHLRRNGVVVKTGFKYGTHFRAYTGPPDEEHAPYLVHALPRERRVAWPEVSGFVRLAHGVRKRLFFAVPGPDGFRLLELKRTRP